MVLTVAELPEMVGNGRPFFACETEAVAIGTTLSPDDGQGCELFCCSRNKLFYFLFWRELGVEKMEKTGCQVICGAPTAVMVKG